MSAKREEFVGHCVRGWLSLMSAGACLVALVGHCVRG